MQINLRLASRLPIKPQIVVLDWPAPPAIGAVFVFEPKELGTTWYNAARGKDWKELAFRVLEAEFRRNSDGDWCAHLNCYLVA